MDSLRSQDGSFPHILHHGAVSGVTGSAHEWVVSDSASVLIDCGLFQGRDTGPGGASAGELAIDFDISRLQALVLTHVHIDHVGRVPWLLAAGFQGPIYCSLPSAKLLPIVLEDAFRLGISRQPVQVERFLKVLEQRLVPLPYDHWQAIECADGSEAEICLQRAGHILGSAYVSCRYRGDHVTVFSGDLGASHAPILPPPASPEGADVLVIESTYGDRRHEGRESRRQRLEAMLVRALADKGTLLIPAFSIGRTQELLYELEEIIHENRQHAMHPFLDWDELPIVLDSPLASRFTQVYRELSPYWEDEARDRLAEGRRPLEFDQLLTVDDHEAHMRMVRHLADSARPAVVIAASGMCAGGRIVNYLKAMLGDQRHNVLFVGYQAAGTLGREIQRAGQGGRVRFDEGEVDIQAGVDSISGYSAHADQQDLLDFVSGMARWPSEIRVVHGDGGAKRVLRQRLRDLYEVHDFSVSIECPVE
ncbi:MBL fold metallo-hydrolase [Alcanivorax sp. NBRC 102024]|uniref:MBL fold metallo-hydrolase n=1 Tax=Alcanivorax sp. NBRC 102024 TaxID=1113895 RepID=UPI0009ECF9F5|nr:MBL fold metallo-hydrolase [Alcanivorax sp. NBRC 102024]